MTKRLLICALCVAAWGLGRPVLSQTPAQQPPRFTAGVDLMSLELTVLDKRTRKPIRGLTADDFIVKVAGTPQVIEAFEEVRVAARSSKESAVFREAAPDVATNELEQPRLFLVVMDDVFAAPDKRGNDGFTRKKAIDIAHALVDGLGPGDLAAVVFAEGNEHAQDFTANRVALRQAIETFRPRPLHEKIAPVVSLGVLERANGFMRRMPGYRRAILWVTLGPLGEAELDVDGLMNWTAQPGQPVSLAANEITETIASGASRVGAGGTMAPVPIYAYSLEGLKPVTVSETQGRSAMPNPFGHETLQRVTADTGGRVIHGTNAPDRVVSSMFDELSSYYTLAYRSDFPMDGRLRWLQVEVKGRDVIVVPTDTAFTTPRIVDGKPVLPSRAERPAGLMGALAGPVPSGAIRLSLAATPLAVSDRRAQMLALTVGLPAPTMDSSAVQYGLSVLVFDGEGRRQILAQQQTVTTPSRRIESDALAEVAVPLALSPGRYAVRVAVQNVATGDAGSVYTTVVVPDFAREPLALSGVAVGRAEGRPIGGREALADVLPFAPTTVRTFAAADRVGALLRIHQAGRALADAVVTTEIVNLDDAVVVTASRTVPAEEFASGAGVDHLFELPLKTLAPGDYLLRFTVTAGKERAHRDVRFTVTP